MSKSILVIHTQSALNTLAGKEALDLSLIFGSYEQNVRILFAFEGVTQALAHQNPEAIGQKDYLSTIKLLDIYDIEQLYVCADSIENLGFQEAELQNGIEPISAANIDILKQKSDHIYVI